MKNKRLIGFILALVVIVSVILPLTANADSNTATSSGSGISTGYKDWIKAIENIGTDIEAGYLQLEASWYNEAYDIYRIYLNFDITQDVTHATLTIYPTGVIYNQDDIKLVIVDNGQRIGEIGLSSLNIRTKSTIELDGIITGSLILMSSSEWYNLPPSKWNWITLDNNTEKPYLTYDSTQSQPILTIIKPSGLNSSAIAGYVILGISIVVIIGLLIWRFAR
jgi:hypothetical protein